MYLTKVLKLFTYKFCTSYIQSIKNEAIECYNFYFNDVAWDVLSCRNNKWIFISFMLYISPFYLLFFTLKTLNAKQNYWFLSCLGIYVGIYIIFVVYSMLKYFYTLHIFQLCLYYCQNSLILINTFEDKEVYIRSF